MKGLEPSPRVANALLKSIVLSTCIETKMIAGAFDPFQPFSVRFNPTARDQNVIRTEKRTRASVILCQSMKRLLASL
jgi:hypothetical protein